MRFCQGNLKVCTLDPRFKATKRCAVMKSSC